MAPRTIFKDLIPEASSRLYQATLRDYLGVAIPLGAMVSITLTLRDVASGQIVNSRDEQNVLNANGGTFGADGAFTFLFTPADTAAIGAGQRQDRLATFKVTYNTGAENHEVQFTVFNMADVP